MGKKRDLDAGGAGSKTIKKQATLSFGGGGDSLPGTKWGKPLMEEMQDQVNIWSWNINGANATIKKGSLQEFLEKANPDIVCLNETKTDPEKIDKQKFWAEIPSDYEQHWNCSKVQKGYAGTAIFTKIKPLKVTHDLGIPKHDGEGRVITMEFEKLHLVAVYTPNAGEGLKRLSYRTKEWDVDFFNHLKSLESSGKTVICSGDLNVAHKEIDIYDPKGKEKIPGFTPQERTSFGNFLQNEGYIDTFRHLYPEEVKYSFWSIRANLRPSNRGWRLDYFLINQRDVGMVKDSQIHNEYTGSDHCPISLRVEVGKSKGGEKEKKNPVEIPKSPVKETKSPVKVPKSPSKVPKSPSKVHKSPTQEIVDSDQISKKSRSKSAESLQSENLKSDRRKRAKSKK